MKFVSVISLPVEFWYNCMQISVNTWREVTDTPKSCATPENPDGNDPTVVHEAFYGMTPADLAEKYNRDETYKMLTGKEPTKDFFLSVMSSRSSKGGSKKAAKKLEETKAKLAAAK